MTRYDPELVKRIRRMISLQFRGGYDESNIGRRGRIACAIEDNAENGFVALEVWQMDCDCASWTVYKRIKAHVMPVDAYCNDVYQCAEGPVNIRMLPPSEIPAKEDRPRPRDHALEAFEDGHPYSVRI